MNAGRTRPARFTRALTAALLTGVIFAAPATAAGGPNALTGQFPLGTHTLCCRAKAHPPQTHTRSRARPKAPASSTATSPATSTTTVWSSHGGRLHGGGTKHDTNVSILIVAFVVVGLAVMVALLLSDRRTAVQRRRRSSRSSPTFREHDH